MISLLARPLRPSGNHNRAMTTRAGWRNGKRAGAEQEGPLDAHRVGPFCLIGVRVNAEPMRLEKSKTPLASPAPYAAHAAASARFWAQAAGRRGPLPCARARPAARPAARA